MIALLLALVAINTQPGRGGAQDSARMVARVRSAETRFLLEWRKLWAESYSGGSFASARLDAVHCHYDGSFNVAPHLIRSAYAKRSMCPIWYPSTRDADERDGIDVALSPGARERARALRASMLALLDSAAAALPGDRFIAGQRVRLHLDQGDVASARRAARECRAGLAWCGLLDGLVSHRAHDVIAADSGFMRAVGAMSWDERCAWNDISLLLPEAQRARFRQIGCDERVAIVDRFWWLADPLYSEPGNERRVEHFARRTTVELHRALTIDERWDWRDEYGGDAIVETLIRYGWPSFVGWAGTTEDFGHFEWLRFTDSSVNVSAEYVGARNHVTPDLAAILPNALSAYHDTLLAPARTRSTPNFDTSWWPVEHYERARGLIVSLARQSAVFRREHDDVVAVAVAVGDAVQPGDAGGRAALMLVSRSPSHVAVVDRVDTVRRGGVARLTALVPTTEREGVVSVELVPTSANGAGDVGRARFVAALPAPLSTFSADSFALSDLLMFDPGQSDPQPGTLEQATARMLPSLEINRGSRLGVFWEMYGAKSGDTLSVALRVERTSPLSLLSRVGSRLGIGSGGSASVSLRWREPRPDGPARTGGAGESLRIGGVGVRPRSLVLDLSRLAEGEYLVELTVGGDARPSAMARRRLTVRR